MNYTNILEELLLAFPELKRDLEDNNYFQDLPHCFCDIVLVSALISACKNGEKNFLVRAGEFFEKMALCEDKRVRELLNVSILESLVLEQEDVIPILKGLLGKATVKELEYWQKRYNKLDI